MKKVVRIFIFIFIILLVFSAIVYIDYFCVKNKNIAPKIALKSEINSETTEYKAIFYKVWYCNSNKKYMIGSYDDDSSICPIKYIYYENGYYSNPQDIKISKRDIEVMTDNGYYTSEMIDGFKTDEEVENAVYVAYNYGKTLYKNVTDNNNTKLKSTDGYNLVVFPEFKSDNNEKYSWVYNFDDESKYYCVKTESGKTFYSSYLDKKCIAFVQLTLDSKWCNLYKKSTIVYNKDKVKNLCEE